MARKIKKKDLAKVIQIWRQVHDENHGIGEEDWKKRSKYIEKELKKMDLIYVQEVQDAIGGFIGIDHKKIREICVKKDYQNQGLGKKLLKKAKSKKNDLSVCVSKENQKALYFFLREGFSVSKVRMNPKTDKEEYILKWKS